MKIFLRIQLSLLFIISLLFTSEKLKAQNVTIIESESYASWATMDSVWWNAAKGLGYNVKVVQYSALNSIDSLVNTNVLIVSSAVLSFTQPSQLQTVIDFVRSGRPAYIQAEYLTEYQGDSTFQYLMDTLGEPFKWTGEVSGDLAPMEILKPFSQTPDTVSFIDYFNFGQTGTGGTHIDSFLEYQGQYYGFYYYDSTSCNGAVVTCSDEDWIYPNDCPSLLTNILYRLIHSKNCTMNGIESVRETINIYPNPFADYITYFVPDDVNRIDIFNETGQMVLTKITSGSNNQERTIETNSLPPGLYVLRAMGTSSIYVQKIIKE